MFLPKTSVALCVIWAIEAQVLEVTKVKGISECYHLISTPLCPSTFFINVSNLIEVPKTTEESSSYAYIYSRSFQDVCLFCVLGWP